MLAREIREGKMLNKRGEGYHRVGVEKYQEKNSERERERERLYF